MVFLYIPCKNADEAVGIAGALIEKRAAGSVDIIPIKSISRGAQGLEETEGAAMLVKTIDKNVQEVEDTVRGLHSNKIPCIATFTMYRLNREYKEWLVSSTG